MFNPSNTLPNHHSISKEHITALYEICMRKIKEIVLKEAEHICFTTDCGTSNESFMAITIHFVNSNFSLVRSLLLRFEISTSLLTLAVKLPVGTLINYNIFNWDLLSDSSCNNEST